MAYIGQPFNINQGVTYKYVATSGQTVFTGADSGSLTLTYTINNELVYKNGIKLVRGTQYTCTNTSTITLASGATAGDIVEILAFGTFSVVDAYKKVEIDTFLAGKSNTGHGHAISDVTSLQTTLDGKASTGTNTFSGDQVVQGDITAYRAGGTTGYTFFNSAETKYVGFDGTNYVMPGADLYVNGQAVNATLAGKASTTHNHDTRYVISNAWATNNVYMGWNGSYVALQVDSTWLGAVIHAANFTSYFAMRRVDAGYGTAVNGITPCNSLAGGFVSGIYISFSGSQYKVATHYLQWYWNGTYYGISG